MKHLKSEFDKLTFKEVLIYIIAIICMVAAIVSVFIGMFLPPTGEIHASVLTYFGMSCGFVGTILGISIHFSNKLNEFQEQVKEMLAKMNVDTQKIQTT